MNTINKILLILVSVLLFTACEDKIERDPSPFQEGDGIQAYFYADTKTSLSFIPDQEPVFKINIGRNNAKEATTLTYTIVDEDGVFELPSSITFAAGETLAEIEVDFSALDLGLTAKLTLELNEDDSYIYGLSAVTIMVSRDYKWVSAGVVEMTSGWAGTTAEIKVQHAEGTGIYRLISPYFVLEPDYADEGYHLMFELDEDYNAFKCYNRQLIGETNSDGLAIEFFNAGFGDTFTNNKNIFTFNVTFFYVRADGTAGGWAGISETFIWKEGYEGEVGEDPNYFEGENEAAFDVQLTMSDVFCVWYNQYSNPETDTYYLEFEDNSGNHMEMYLFAEENAEGSTVLKSGTYVIDSSEEVGTVLAGYKPLGELPDGTFLYLPLINNYFYLTEGEVVVEKEGGVYKISVDAISAFGSNIKVEWTGNIDVVDIMDLLSAAPKKSNGQKDVKKISKRGIFKSIGQIG